MHFHLTQTKRIELSLLIRSGVSQRATAVVLGVHPSTVCRELKRNTLGGRRYHARVAWRIAGCFNGGTKVFVHDWR